jgi:predicted MPP superfamily phosphohydrolase
MLEIGYNSNFEVRSDEATYNGKHRIRVLYLSDLHFNRFSRPMVTKLISEIEKWSPDLTLLGGDYVDTKKGLVHLSTLLKELSQQKSVFAIAGNHDHFFGIEQVKEVMVKHNISWIEKRSVQLRVGDCLVQIDGTIPASLQSKADLKILCLHQPIDLNKLPVTYDLAFAGHLHGSQFVCWKTEKGLYPGRLFYKWNTLKIMVKDCHYYISKGLGDTLPLRFNCRKELLVVDLMPLKIE